MRMRTLAAATAAALALTAGGSAAALAASTDGHARGTTVSAAAKGQGKSQGKGKRTKVAVNFGGTVRSVDAAAGTLTVTVKGGRDKAVRGTDVTVTVPAAATVRREATDGTETAISLADVVAGERARVKGVRAADGTVTATRVSVEAAETD